MSKLNEFISESKTFNGFEFIGCYTIKNKFLMMYDVFLNDGINLLDCYSDYIYLSWIKDLMSEYKTYEECDKIGDSLSLLRRYKICDCDDLADQRARLKIVRNNYQRHLESISNIPRRDANIFTSKISTKEKVFDLYGRKCLCCGSTENITIDHVVSVKNGGVNEIENMQPLCKSCNSRKSTKTIDYR